MPAMPLARRGLENDSASSEQVRRPTDDAALDVGREKPALAYTLVKKAADDCEQLSIGKAHGRRRMATAARPVARARRLDRCRGANVVGTQDGVPTWEVRRSVKVGSVRDDLITDGTADSFEAAKAAALFEARAVS